MNAIELIKLSKNIKNAYEKVCEPLCEEMNLPQVALDILLFLGNNSQYCTAKYIQKFRNIKPNLISLYVEKLVLRGYLKRDNMSSDRRQVRLICTESAKPIILRGQKIQSEFSESLGMNISMTEQKMFISCIEKLNENARQIIETEN